MTLPDTTMRDASLGYFNDAASLRAAALVNIDNARRLLVDSKPGKARELLEDAVLDLRAFEIARSAAIAEYKDPRPKGLPK